MRNYRLIASDLDGTLLDPNGKISRENLAAIGALSERNIFFVPTSGRGFSEIPKELKDCPNIRYYICSSGAVVSDKQTNENISFCFPKELSERLLQILLSEDCHITVRRLGRIFTDLEKQNEECYLKYKVWSPHAELLRHVSEGISDFSNHIATANEIEMISVFTGDDACYKRLQSKLSQIPDINIACACPHNVELTYCKAGKGNALMALAEKLGISIDQTIAVGDSENDVPMISAAGLGMAMRNASDSVKQHADAVACSNSEHVAKYILETVIL